MTDEQFQTVSNWLAAGHRTPTHEQVMAVMSLLDEVERLRAEEATMRPIVAVVAELETFAESMMTSRCAFCDEPDEHTPDCPATKARALLEKHEHEDDESLTCEGCGKALYLNGETLCSMCAEAGPLN